MNPWRSATDKLGVIDSNLNLTQGDGKVTQEGAEIDSKQVQGRFMCLYVSPLMDYLSHTRGETRTRALAFDHLQQAGQWLAEHGIGPTLTSGASWVN